MAGIAGATGGGTGNIQLAAQYQARVAAMQKDAVNQAGQAALKLIEAAAQVTEAANGGIDIRI